MKKILLSFIAFFVASGLFFFILKNSNPYFVPKLISKSPCDTPIPYKIGRVDSQFNLKKEEFLNKIEESSGVWNNVKGKPLFVYDPKAALTIDLIYDEKQYLTTKINTLEEKLKNEKTSIDAKVEEYERLSLDFKKRSKALSDNIFYWNSQGGAPQREYEKLIQEQESLVKEADALNTMAKELNRTTDSFNTEIKTLNQTVSSFNDVIKSKPEEGLYVPNEKKIYIFFYSNDVELRRTIIHELGHALGLSHVANPDALMYFRTTDKLEPTTDDINELSKICENYTPLEFMGSKILLITNTIINIGTKTY